MTIGQRKPFSKALKAAVAAGAVALMGSVFASSAHASLMTIELVPTSTSSGGTINGQSVQLPGPGTINYNIVAVLHGVNAATDGMQQASISMLSDSGGVLGQLSAATSPAFTFFLGAQEGTPNPGVDIGPDRPGQFTDSSLDTQTFFPQSATLGTVPANVTSGDASQILGTGTFTVTASNGSTTVQPVLHTEAATNANSEQFLFTLDGVNYALNGNGSGVANGAPFSSASALDVNGGSFSVTVGSTPEPGSLALAGLGGLGLLLRRRRK